MVFASERTPLASGVAAVGDGSLRTKKTVKAVGLLVVVAATIAVVATLQWAGPTSNFQQSSFSLGARGESSLSAPDQIGDLIEALPGMPATYTARLFSGYLPIANGAEGFYFFAESQSPTPHRDPVLLWLNGGPGASSLAGCFSENGPLLVNDDGETLRVNDFAWNQNANMLCIESPIGVGFSYNASGVYKSDDEAQADDLYWMLQSFYVKFPWLRENDFIISGESYGGIYVPMTAKRIVEGNAQANKTSVPVINLKRFVVGNGANEFLSLSKVVFAYYHALISTDDYKGVAVNCPELLTPGTPLAANASTECWDALGQVSQTLQESGVNNYNIYATCSGSPLDGFQDLLDALLGPMQPVPHPVRLSMSLCLNETGLTTYFNTAAVRTAVHAKTEVEKWSGIVLTTANLDIPSLLNVSDDEVTTIIDNKVLTYGSTAGNITPLWRFLLNHGVEGLIYHGDVDMACDFIGGLWAVESLKLPRQQKRRVWTVEGDDQTAGFVEDFGALTYVTVKGSGHMVPSDKPREAKAMLDQFVLQ